MHLNWSSSSLKDFSVLTTAVHCSGLSTVNIVINYRVRCWLLSLSASPHLPLSLMSMTSLTRWRKRGFFSVLLGFASIFGVLEEFLFFPWLLLLSEDDGFSIRGKSGICSGSWLTWSLLWCTLGQVAIVGCGGGINSQQPISWRGISTVFMVPSLKRQISRNVLLPVYSFNPGQLFLAPRFTAVVMKSANKWVRWSLTHERPFSGWEFLF